MKKQRTLSSSNIGLAFRQLVQLLNASPCTSLVQAEDGAKLGPHAGRHLGKKRVRSVCNSSVLGMQSGLVDAIFPLEPSWSYSLSAS